MNNQAPELLDQANALLREIVEQRYVTYNSTNRELLARIGEHLHRSAAHNHQSV